MNLRTIIAGACVALLGLTTTPAGAQTNEPDRPNVILIYADDLGYGDLGCYGATKIQTPNIDKLASEGLRFTNAHCTAATCTPSRYSILTGQYAWRKKGTGILPGDAGLIIPTDRATLGKVFQKAGYQTACVGKWHLGLGPETGPDWNGEIKPGPNEVGFDYSFIFPATADRVPTVYVENHKVVALDPDDPIAVNYDEKIGTDPTGKENPELLKMKSSPGHGHNNTIVNGIGRIGWMTGGHAARWTDESLAGNFTEQAEIFMEKNKAKPFFLYFALSDIHVPRMPDTRFKGKSGLGYRGDAILEMDHIVGRIMANLEQLGLKGKTLVIFSSDNGPVVDDGYQDGSVEKLNGHKPGGPMRGGKYSILEAGARVPFIMNWPGKVEPGVSGALVSQVDLVASFASMFGQELSAPDAPDSENVMPALLGKAPTGRESIVVASRTLALIKGDWKYIEPHAGKKLMELVNIETGLNEQPQLYNLKDDIGENNNLAAQNPEKVTELAEELAKIKGSDFRE